jgi:DNA helicase-2/ATP-dependent DNA helicase PcrA
VTESLPLFLIFEPEGGIIFYHFEIGSHEEGKLEDRIFIEEQDHLKTLYQKLTTMKEELEAELVDISEKAAEEKKTTSEDLRLNFNNDAEAQETLIEFEVMSQAVAQLNIASDSVSAKLKNVDQLLPRAYFARIDVQFDEDEEPESFYIGSAAVSDQHHDQLVVDWRSPIAEVYYNHENGRTSYRVDDRRIEVDLCLRRQFDLKADVLNAYFDTKIAIEDPLLLRSLSRKRTDQMQAITETIQREQNTVIRYPDVPALLVSGIAGSGKTSVLLQRIAYLFFRMRKQLRPEQVYLITLNPVFQQYISHVLPEMGEQNPNNLTWGEFLDELGLHGVGEGDLTEAASLRQIDRGLASIVLTEEDFCQIRQKHQVVLTQKQIADVVAQHPNIETGVRLIQICLDELEEAAQKSASDLEKKRISEDGESDEEGQTDRNPQKMKNRIMNQYGGAIQAIRSFKWLNLDRIGSRLLGRKKLTPAETFYLKMALTGLCNRNAKYVMIDEVQDYTEAQMLVFLRYFKNARFMMLGDEFQSIHEGNISFERIHQIFQERGKDLAELSLLTSYRSSPEITDLFTGLLPKEVQIKTSSIQRPGLTPVIRSCTHENYKEVLRQAVKEAEGEPHLTAVICQDWTGVNRISQILGGDGPEIIRDNESLPESGAILLELRLAKGLEFDSVILPDVTAHAYPDKLLARHRLYTAISRATQQLTILSDGPLSPLLGKDKESGR